MLPLHHAIEHMNEVLVRELLHSGADPNAPDPELGGFRPLHIAVDIECEDSCYRYDMGNLNASPETVITRILLEVGANPDLPDDQGKTARSIAKERLHAKALSLFGPEI